MRLGASGAPVPEPRGRGRVLPAVRRSPRRGARRAGARRGLVAAIHVVGRVGLDQRRRLDTAARAGAAGRSARASRRTTSARWRSRCARDVSSPTFDMPPNAERVVDHRREVRAAVLAGRRRHRQASLERSASSSTIVGVVGTVKQYGLDVDGRIVVYRPSRGLLGYQVARTSGDPAALSARSGADDPRDRSDDYRSTTSRR